MHTTVRRKAERLFLRLNHSAFPQQEGLITVSYAERFPLGQCIMAATIPINRQTLRTVIDMGVAHKEYHYPPAIINTRHGRCLRLMYRLRRIRPDENERLFTGAKDVAQWLEKRFGIPAIISPMRGLIGARWRLRAL